MLPIGINVFVKLCQKLFHIRRSLQRFRKCARLVASAFLLFQSLLSEIKAKHGYRYPNEESVTIEMEEQLEAGSDLILLVSCVRAYRTRILGARKNSQNAQAARQ
jgi:hypothetical protein